MHGFDEVTINDDPKALVPEGLYEVVYVSHVKHKYFNQEKLYVNFKVIAPIEYSGLILTRNYTYYLPAKRNSDYIKECQIVLGRKLNKKEKVSPNVFKDKALKVRVRTVRKNRKQDIIPEFLQHSVIDSILERTTGIGE